MSYFAQFGEDRILSEFFESDYTGTCIDIGASDGISISNTYHFELKGWKCLCIEANPSLFESLKQNRKNVLNVAVGLENKNSEFNIVRFEDGNETAISSLKIDDRLLNDYTYLNPSLSKTIVLEKTLDSILNENDWIESIDFISIDTEGTELDVIRGFDLDKWSPKVLCVENNYNDSEIENYLLNFGYKKVLRNEVNDFYTK